jgi:hypothetical protein
MKKVILYSIVIVIFSSCYITQQITLSPVEVKAMTTKQFEASYDMTFRAVISLLQSEGFLIESANTEVGLINASKRIDNKNAEAELFWTGVSKDASTAKTVFYIEEINKELTEVKLTIYEGTISSDLWTGMKNVLKESMIQDATIYNTWFNHLRAEIERRKALR